MNPGLGIGMGLSPSPGGAVAGGASGRILKVFFPAPTNFCQLYELEVYEAYGGANVALGKAITANTAGAGAAANAVDGNVATFWATGGVSAPAPDGHWLRLDAGAGNVFAPRVIGWNPSSPTEAPLAMKAWIGPDDAGLVQFLDYPAIAAPLINGQRRLFATDGDEVGGYRYHWLKLTGNNFAGATTSYVREIKLNNVKHNCALENIALGGTGSNLGYGFGREVAGDGNGGALCNGLVGTTFGVDHGPNRKRVLTSVTLDYSTVTLYCQHAFKQFEIYGSNVAIGDAGGTLLGTFNDAGGTPADGSSRTFAL
jgi:hypothetical protein